MRNATITLNSYLDDLVRDLNRFAVGYEPTLRVLENIRYNTANQGFPPYDLEKTGENTYRLSMAVAGYSPEDLEITEHQGVLTIAGKVQNDESRNYLHKGIAGRSFRKSFYVAEHVKVTDSDLANGVLTINFEMVIPEALKPRRIEIRSTPAIEG